MTKAGVSSDIKFQSCPVAAGICITHFKISSFVDPLQPVLGLAWREEQRVSRVGQPHRDLAIAFTIYDEVRINVVRMIAANTVPPGNNIDVHLSSPASNNDGIRSCRYRRHLDKTIEVVLAIVDVPVAQIILSKQGRWCRKGDYEKHNRS